MIDKEKPRAREYELNAQLGKQIRIYRRERKIKQHEVGAHLGVSFQQVQKWEQGRNRISAARLHMLCDLFGLTLAQFFLE